MPARLNDLWRLLFQDVETIGRPSYSPNGKGPPRSFADHAMELTDPARHGSGSPKTRHAATAPRSACS